MEEESSRRLRLFSLEQDGDALSAELGRIHPSLFAREEELGLQRLFSDELERAVAQEAVKFEGVLRSLLRAHAAPGRQRPARPRARPGSFKKAATDLLLRNFDAAFAAIFPAGGGKGGDPLLTLCAGFMDFALATLGGLAARLLDAAGGGPPAGEKLLDSSLTDRSLKRAWGAAEEGALSQLVEAHYPQRVPPELLQTFGDAHQRTPSAVLNKLHKLRRRCGERLLGEGERVPLEDAEPLERRLRGLVEQRGQLTYDEAFEVLGVQRGDGEAANCIDLALYALLNREELRCEERCYVELADAALCPPSPILQRLLQLLAKRGRALDFAETRLFLLGEFRELDAATPHFDRDLLDYLCDCPAFAVKSKRVFLAA